MAHELAGLLIAVNPAKLSSNGQMTVDDSSELVRAVSTSAEIIPK
jgi:hypothetical protein